MAENLKYTITDRINKMLHQEALTAKKELPEIVGVSRTTFRDYCLRKESDSTQIPSENLLKLALFFGCNPSELFTNPPEI